MARGAFTPGAPPVLVVESLTVDVQRDGLWLPAVRQASFVLHQGEHVALVGESGSGKSLTALAIGRLLPPGARIGAGRIEFAGTDLTSCSTDTIRGLRGRSIGFVFQDPTAALDPTMRVGRQVEEPMEAHELGDARSRRNDVAAMLSRVGIVDAHRRLNDYPHQFSGGMRQRVMIASALITRPRLLVADEPTSALDATVQAQILETINALSTEMGLAVLFITHDLAVARAIADRLIIMYGGRILEDGPAETILTTPHHPYTQALLALAPRRESGAAIPEPIPGTPIPGWLSGDACPFATRCPFVRPRCRTTAWALADVPDDRRHRSACVVAPEGRRRSPGAA